MMFFFQSEGLADAFYQSLWYEFPTKAQKFLLIIGERCKRPISMKAGGFFILDLPLFATVGSKISIKLLSF